MPLFVTNASQTLPHDVYAIDTPVPAVVQPIGEDTAVIVGQFPWGPSEALTYGSSMQAILQTFAPAGMTRTGSAYLSIIRKAWPRLGVVRVKDATAVASSAQLTQSAALRATVTASSTGTQGNSIILTVAAASDGNVNHFNLTAQVSSASGTTTEIYQNLNISGTGADVLPNLSASVLLGSFVKNNPGVPDNGNTTMGSGTDGSVTAPMYVGTPGTNNLGFALLEGDDTISNVFTDDPGNSIRATVNAGAMAHGDLLGDRIIFLNGNSGQTAAQAQTDVANYRSIHCVYVDPWAYINDDTTGALQLMPGSSWGASVASQLPPSTAISWRDDRVSALLDGIAKLEFDRGTARAANDAAQISTLIRRKRGGFTFEAGLNTSATAGIGTLVRTRMGIFIAKSTVESWEPLVDAPNILPYQQDLVNSEDVFLRELKQNGKDLNAAFLPYIVDYLILPIGSSNTQASIQAGNFTTNAQVELGASMSRIYLALQYGESVVVNVQ